MSTTKARVAANLAKRREEKVAGYFGFYLNPLAVLTFYNLFSEKLSKLNVKVVVAKMFL